MSITFQAEDEPAASVNFSNVNACAMLQLAGLAAEPEGMLAAEDVSRGIRRLLRALNAPRSRSFVIRDQVRSGRFLETAQTDPMVRQRISRLLELFAVARRVGCGVVWH